MCKKVEFNVIEKNKFDDIEDITKYIQAIVNKLIIEEFANRINSTYRSVDL